MKYSSSIKTVIFTFIINFFLTFNSFADNHNIYEILDQLQKDIKTLEKAVYSGSVELENKSMDNSNISSADNSGDVLTYEDYNMMKIIIFKYYRIQIS